MSPSNDLFTDTATVLPSGDQAPLTTSNMAAGKSAGAAILESTCPSDVAMIASSPEKPVESENGVSIFEPSGDIA